MANEPLIGSQIVCGVDSVDSTLPKLIPVNTATSPPGMVVDVASRSLRDLGKVDSIIEGPTGTQATVRDLAANDALNVAIVDGAGDQITSFGGGTQYADGAARGTATGTLAMGDDGTNIQSVKVDAAGELQVDVLTLPANASVNVAQHGGVAVPAGFGGYVAVIPGSAASIGADALTPTWMINPGVTNMHSGALGHVFNGATWDRTRGNTVGAYAHGTAAADAATTGNPLLNGAQAETAADSAPATRVDTDGDAVKLAADRDGALYVHPHGPQIWNYHENSSSALTDAEVHAAPAAVLSLYVTDIVVSTGAATAFNIFFEEATTTRLGPYYLEAVAGRGFAIHFVTPKKLTAATALTVTTSAAILHSIEVNGYIAP